MPIVQVNYATFDGTNDSIIRSAGLSGAAAGKTGTISFWIKMNGGDGVRQDIIYLHSAELTLRRAASNKIEIYGFTSGLSQVLFLQSTSNLTADGNRHHVMASWDLAAGVGHLYIDNVDVLNAGSKILVNNNIGYATTDFAIGAASDGTSNRISANLGQIYVNQASYIDLSNSTNRAKFYNSSRPVDFGSDGSTPTGTTPGVYLNNIYSSFQTNLGNGGNFTVNGALTDGGSWSYITESITESLTASDSNGTIQSMPNALGSMGITAADNMAAGKVYASSITESLTAAHSNTTVQSMPTALGSMGLTAADNMDSAVLFLSAFSESLTSADSMASSVNFRSSVAESLTAADSVASKADFRSSFTEGLTAAELMSTQVSYSASLTYSLTAADSVASKHDMPNAISEAVTAAENMGVGANYNNALSFSIATADALTTKHDMVCSVSDSLIGSESMASKQDFVAIFQENITAGDDMASQYTPADGNSAGGIVILYRRRRRTGRK